MLLAHEASGRSLLEDPAFIALARAYHERVEAPPRGSVRDVTEGHWYALALVPGSERVAIDRIADEVRVPLYLPMRRDARISWRGKWHHYRRALFTGYGFVQLANLNDLLGQICGTEGVRGIMCEGSAESGRKPAIIRAGFDDCRKGKFLSPLRFDGELVDFIRRVEAGASDWLLDLTGVPAAARHSCKPGTASDRRRTRRKRRKNKHAQAAPVPAQPGA